VGGPNLNPDGTESFSMVISGRGAAVRELARPNAKISVRA